MTRISRLILAVSFGSGLILATARARADDEIRYPGYVPDFPAPAPTLGIGPVGAPGTWLGGDAGFCCPLDAESSFWSFADVAIGDVGAKTRLDSTNHKKNLAVGNSIAIATCRDGRFEPQHFFRGSPDQPLPFFADPNNPLDLPKGSRLWPRKATLIGGRLYLFAHQIVDPGSVTNTFLIRVDNPHESPEHWKYAYLHLGLFPSPTIGTKAVAAPIHFGNEAFVDPAGTYLYTYGVYASTAPGPGGYGSRFRVTALRIPIAALEAKPAWGDLGRDSEYLSKGLTWKAGLDDPADHHEVGIPAFNGFSVRFNPILRAWQAVFCYDDAHLQYVAGKRTAGDPLVDGAYAMISPEPYGPWGTPARVAEIPEMDPARSRAPVHAYNPDAYGYFVGEKSAFAISDRQVVFTYSIGSYAKSHGHDFGPIDVDMKEYVITSWAAANPLVPAVDPPKPIPAIAPSRPQRPR